MPPNPSSKKLQKYGALPDVEAEEGTEGTTDSSSYESSPLLYDVTTTTKPTKEKSTYDLTFAFQLMSGFVWASMSIWGVWISVYYSIAALTDWNKFNIVFPDLYTPDRPLASFAICFHLVGAAFMAMAGAFQLVKYIRKEHPVFHRWVGRLYIVSSLIASIGALIFIFTKGDYGGKPADYAFGTYGIIFLTSGTMTYYYAYRREFLWHKLWAWRLYSLSLAAWMYRFDYYWWELLFGKGEDSWLHSENFQAGFDIWINWMVRSWQLFLMC